MSSSSFRLISAAISTLLLAALVIVIIVAVRDNPSTALPRLAATQTQPARVAQTSPTPPASTAEAAGTPTVSPSAQAAGEPMGGEPTDGEASEPASGAAVATPATATPQATVAAESTATLAAMPTASPSAPGATPAAVPAADSTRGPTAEATEIDTEIDDVADDAIGDLEGEIEAESTPAAAARVTSPFARATEPAVRIYSNGNFVNAVAVMRSTIWAATSGGVVAWNKNSGGYVKFTVSDGLSTNRAVATAVCLLPDLGVLFGSPQGIQVFDTQNGGWKTLDSNNSPMQHDDVSVLWCDADDGLLVVGYTENGLDIFDSEAGEWTYIGADEGLDISGVRDLAVSSDRSTVWLATVDGLFAFANGEVTRYTTENSPLIANRIDALALDGSGAVWLTSGDTLYRTRNDEWELYSAADATGSFPNGRLIGLDVSPNGTIWLGSDQSQICRFDPGVKGCVSFFAAEEGMATAPLTSLTIGSDDAVYYTTAGGGISIYEGDSWRQLRIENEAVPGNAVRHLALDANGGVWVASLGGVGRIDPAGEAEPQQYTPSNSTLPSVDVRVVLPSDDGVWVGAEGVSYFDGASWITYGPEDGLAGTHVQAIAADSQERFWIGTAGGLSIWTGSDFFNLTTDNGLPSDDITALQADGEIMWIGTRGGGLLRFEDNQLQLFNVNNSNLPANTITALARGSDGAIWIGTAAGVARFAGNELTGNAAQGSGLAGQAIRALAAGPEGTLWAATDSNALFRYDGTAWAAFDAAKRPSPQITALLVDQSGELWLGTADGGLARYTP